jgi:hypothetical protein
MVLVDHQVVTAPPGHAATLDGRRNESGLLMGGIAGRWQRGE